MKKILLLLTAIVALGFVESNAQIGPGSTGSATAPLLETFAATGLPTGWAAYQTTGTAWIRATAQTSTGGCPFSGDYTSGGGTGFARHDQSGGDGGNCMQMPDIYIGGLSRAYISYAYFMCGTNYTPANQTFIEYWDGTAWASVFSHTAATSGWEVFCHDISTFTFNTGADSVRLRFRAESGGASADFYGDNSIDDVEIFDNPACTGAPMAPVINPASYASCGVGGSSVTMNAFSSALNTCNLADYTFQWEEASAATGPWTAVTGGTGATDTTYTSAVLTTTTYFRCVMTCVASTMSTPSNTATVNIGAAPTIGMATAPASATVCAGTAASVSLDASSTTGATTYSWSPASGLSATTGATVSASPTTTTEYIITASDAVGCTATSAVTVTVTQIDSLILTASPQNVCANGSSALTAEGCFIIDEGIILTEVSGFNGASGWVDPPTPFPTGISDPIEITNSTFADVSIDGWQIEVTGANPGTYTFPAGAYIPANSAIVLERDAGGTQTDIAGLYYNTALSSASSSAASGFILSDGLGNIIDVVSLNNYAVVGTGTPAATAADWSGTTPSTSGTGGLRRTVNTDNNLASDWTVANTANVVNYGFLNTEFSTISCDTNGTKYGMTYSWSPATYLSPSVGHSVTASNIAGPITYTATAFDPSTGCVATQTISLTQDPLGMATATASDTLICENDSTQLMASIASGGSPPFAYSWSPNAGMEAGGDTLANPMAAPSTTTTYTVTITDACATTATAMVTITVNPAPIITATALDIAVCEGSSTDLMVSGNADTYTWTPGGAGDTITVTPTASTSYTVTGTTTATGCTADTVIPVIFVSTTYDTINASADTICLGSSVTLTAGDSTAPVAGYCASNATNAADTHIDSTTINGVVTAPLPLTTGSTYTDNTGIIIPVTAGTAFPISITKGATPTSTYTAWVKVYIDLDQNGVFDLPGEEFTSASAGAFGSGRFTVTDNITIPLSALDGPTRMRVVLEETSAAANVNPCGIFTYGETEDYTVNISGATPVVTPVYTYTWEPGTLTGATQTLSPTTTTTYTATQTGVYGCTAVDSVTIEVLQPAFTVTPASQIICENGTTPAQITVADATALSWSPTTALTLNGTNDTAMALPTATTTYVITGTDSNGCVGTQEATVSLELLPILDSITATRADVCPGDVETVAANFIYPLGAAAYCASNATSTADTRIDTVSFAGVTVGAAVDANYTDNTATVIPVTAGTTYPIDIYKGDGAGSSYSAYAKVFIDFDQSNTFEANEEVYGQGAGSPTGWMVTGNVTIPTTALNGQTRMRVILRESGSSISTQACGTFTWGETEEYTLDISGGAAPLTYTYAWTAASSVTMPTMASTTTTPIAATTTYIATATSPNGCSAMDSVIINVNPLSAAVVTATPTAICDGDSTQLNVVVTGGGTPYTYSWTPNTGMQPGADTTMNPMAAPSASGGITAFVQDACNNVAASAVFVTVNPNPVVTVMASDTVVCDGDSTMLSATSSVPSSFDWNPGSLSGAMLTVAPTATTNYMLTVTDSATGCTSDTSVMVNHIPQFFTTATASTSALCAGDSVMLTAADSTAPLPPFCTPTYSTGTQFGDYIDSVGGFGGLLANQTGAASTPFYQLFPTPIAVNTATPYTVTVRNGTFGSQEQSIWIDYNHDSTFDASEQVGQFNSIAANALTTFNVNIPTSAYNGPTLMRVMDDYSGPNPMNPCRAASYGETEDYILNISGGSAPPAPIAYTWTWEPGTLAGAMQTVIPTATTTYTVTQTDPNGCIAEDSVEVMINAVPTLALTATADTVCFGDTVTIMSGAIGANTYTWNGNSGSIDTVLAPAVTGLYTLVASVDSTGCSITDSIMITELPQLAAPTVSTADPNCITGNGNITVTVPSGTGFEYSIDSVNYQASNMFDTLAGTYNVTARTTPMGCLSLPTSVTLNPNSAPCEPNITLGASTIAPSILIGGNSSIDFRINNLGTIPTTGAINVTIGKPTDGTLVLTLPTGWTIVTNNAAIIQITTTNVIQPGFTNSVIIPAVYTHSSVPSGALKSAPMLATPGSGGENKTDDNASGIFIQVN